MNEILKDFKKIGYINHISIALLTIFFIIVSKKISVQLNLFGCIYWYVSSLLVGHYSAHNIKPAKKFKYVKSKNDTFVALPIVGLINMLTYGIPILILDYFYKFLWFFHSF